MACGIGSGGRLQRERLALAASALALGWFMTTPVALVCLLGVTVLYVIVEAPVPVGWRWAGVWAWVVGVVVAPVWAIGWLSNAAVPAKEIVAFGSNMAVLRGISYAHERLTGQRTRPPFERYLFFSLFFPTFVNGPIESPAEVLDGPWLAPTWAQWRVGGERVACGAGKMLLVGLLGPPNWTGQLDRHLDASALWLWGWSFLLYGWFYLCFSAWSDVAIGVGALCGRTVRENFNAPWRAATPADFWRRWHISFGVWLREHVYLPLGGNRRGRARNVAAVFAVSTAWHIWGSLKLFGFGYYPIAAWWGFTLWGILHALAVIAMTRTPSAGWRRAAAVLGTLLFAAWAWFPFFAPASIAWKQGGRLIGRMLGLPL